MAKYDIPAVIDYITSETGNQQVFYVGHSQGTLIAFAKFSEDLQFSKKVMINWWTFSWNWDHLV